MDTHKLYDTLCEGPQTTLLEVTLVGRDPRVILPLLEDELQRSVSRVQRLKEHRNTLASPMYRLQPELLSMIFYIYAKDNDELFDMRWVRLMFVCRRWHDIATRIPKLWGFIDVTGNEDTPNGASALEKDVRDLKRIEAQRARVGLWPVTVRMNSERAVSKQDFIKSNFWDSRSLSAMHVYGENVFIKEALQSLAAQHHPTLSTLALRYAMPVTSYMNGMFLAEVRPLLNLVIKEQAPRLDRLAIAELWFDLALISGLRALCIDYTAHSLVYMHGPLPFNSRDVLDALSRCPALQYLDIRVPGGLQPGNSNGQVAIPLRNIESLYLHATETRCCDLLRSLGEMPSPARIILSPVITWDDDDAIAALASYIGTHASRHNAPNIRALVLTQIPIEGYHNYAQLRLTGRTSFNHSANDWTDKGSSVLTGLDKSDPPYVSIEVAVTNDAVASTLKETLCTWPVASATDLDVRDITLEQDHLPVLLSKLPAVTTVILRPESKTAANLLEALYIHLRLHGRRIFVNIVFDVEKIAYMIPRPHSAGIVARGLPPKYVPSPEGINARRTIIRMMLYCAEAARAGVPLSTIAVVNEQQDAKGSAVFEHTDEVEWSELYKDLQDGFVYDDIMHSARIDLDGTKRDAFSMNTL